MYVDDDFLERYSTETTPSVIETIDITLPSFRSNPSFLTGHNSPSIDIK